jgi:two-component system, sensor histidine kinase ChiS
MDPVFIVEDDSFLAEMLVKKFELDGMPVQWFPTAETALDAIESGSHASAVIVDVLLPDMNGLMFIKTIREKRLLKNVPIVILSNMSPNDLERDFRSLNIADHIIKSNAVPTGIVTRIKALVSSAQNEHGAKTESLRFPGARANRSRGR